MQNGDISNSTPTRLLVNYEFIVNKVKENRVERKWLKNREVEVEVDILDRIILNKLWLLTGRIGCILELFVTPDIDVKDLEQRLDEVVNPFTSIVTVPSVYAVMKNIPYRPDVQGVIDFEHNALVYGSKFFDMARVGI